MIPFHAGDRAYLMDANYTMLRPHLLYHVNAVFMDQGGNQKINLTGTPREDFYNASRFVRVPDSVGRKWPKESA